MSDKESPQAVNNQYVVFGALIAFVGFGLFSQDYRGWMFFAVLILIFLVVWVIICLTELEREWPWFGAGDDKYQRKPYLIEIILFPLRDKYKKRLSQEEVRKFETKGRTILNWLLLLTFTLSILLMLGLSLRWPFLRGNHFNEKRFQPRHSEGAVSIYPKTKF